MGMTVDVMVSSCAGRKLRSDFGNIVFPAEAFYPAQRTPWGFAGGQQRSNF